MIDKQIRRFARKQGLTASKFRSDGLWCFANQFNFLESPEAGLDDEEALEYLTQDVGGKPMDWEATMASAEETPVEPIAARSCNQPGLPGAPSTVGVKANESR